MRGPTTPTTCHPQLQTLPKTGTTVLQRPPTIKKTNCLVQSFPHLQLGPECPSLVTVFTSQPTESPVDETPSHMPPKQRSSPQLCRKGCGGDGPQNYPSDKSKTQSIVEKQTLVLFLRGPTPRGAQGLLLALHSGMDPGGLRQPYLVSGWTQVGLMQGKCSPYYHSH